MSGQLYLMPLKPLGNSITAGWWVISRLTVSVVNSCKSLRGIFYINYREGGKKVILIVVYVYMYVCIFKCLQMLMANTSLHLESPEYEF